MAGIKGKNPGTGPKIVQEYAAARPGEIYGRDGEVSGTVRVIEGVLSSGIPFRTETFTPDRTPEEAAAWENRVRRACREFADGCVRVNGFEWARSRLEA